MTTWEAPFPTSLSLLVQRLTYRPGWRVELANIGDGRGTRGLTLAVTITGPDAYRPEREMPVSHWFVVPPVNYDEQAWRRWLFERLLDAERHEAMEWFQIGAERPYAPHHGPGRDAYTVHERGTIEDTITNFHGERYADA